MKINMTEKRFEALVEKASRLYVEAYQGMWNTSILYNPDTEDIVTHTDAGNTSYSIPVIAFVGEDDRYSFLDYIRGDLSEKERELCREKGYLSLWEGTEEEFTWDDAEGELLEDAYIRENLALILGKNICPKCKDDPYYPHNVNVDSDGCFNCDCGYRWTEKIEFDE